MSDGIVAEQNTNITKISAARAVKNNNLEKMDLSEIVAGVGGCLFVLAIIIFFTIVFIQGLSKNYKLFKNLLNIVPVIGIIGFVIMALGLIMMAIMEIFGKYLKGFWDWLPEFFKLVILFVVGGLLLFGIGNLARLILNLNKNEKK